MTGKEMFLTAPPGTYTYRCPADGPETAIEWAVVGGFLEANVPLAHIPRQSELFRFATNGCWLYLATAFHRVTNTYARYPDAPGGIAAMAFDTKAGIFVCRQGEFKIIRNG